MSRGPTLEWVAGTWAGVDMPKIAADDVILNPFPMINMAAFVGLLLPWLRMGCTLVQHQPFDLMVFLGQIAKERVNYTVAPPALLMMLLHNEALMSQVDISSDHPHGERLGSAAAADGGRLAGEVRRPDHQLAERQRGDRPALGPGGLPGPGHSGALLPLLLGPGPHLVVTRISEVVRLARRHRDR